MALFASHCSGVYCTPLREGTTLLLALYWDMLSISDVLITQCQDGCSEGVRRWAGEVKTKAEEKVEAEVL
jgi:hypothetical protein